MRESVAGPPGTIPLTKKERFFRAVAGQATDRPPVWLMRQAGRYLPEYQAIKANYTFSEMCRIPEVAAEISIQPYERLGVDAIIVFNDILIPCEHMGVRVDFTDSGPVVSPSMRNDRETRRLHRGDFGETPAVYESIRAIRRRVGDETPILGFAGAPFTLATYLVEGAMSKNLRYLKEFLYDRPSEFERILDLITETVVEYLWIQIRAGADAVQIFDTWAGTLTLADYRRFALPYQKRIIASLQADGTPVILYVNGSTPFLREMKESGATVLSVDWRTDLRSVLDRLDGEAVLQGNLDPAALYASPETVRRMTLELMRNFGRTTGHIVNLGHGILPETPVESVQALVETVQSYAYP